MYIRTGTYHNPAFLEPKTLKNNTRYPKVRLVYSAFGAPLSGRISNACTYRYGMNGQEKDEELGSGVTTAEYWEYDAKLGRRWNVDPKPFVDISRYACFVNNPILFPDPNGDIVDPGEKGTREYRRNMREHRRAYRKSETYRKMYDQRSASDETYHLHFENKKGVKMLKDGGTTTDNSATDHDWKYSSGGPTITRNLTRDPSFSINVTWNDRYLSRNKKITGSHIFDESSKESFTDNVILSKRVPNTSIRIDALSIPDFFTVFDNNTGAVIVPTFKLGSEDKYYLPEATPGNTVINPPGNHVIRIQVVTESEVDRSLNNPERNGTGLGEGPCAQPPASQWLIVYRKFYFHYKLPSFTITR